MTPPASESAPAGPGPSPRHASPARGGAQVIPRPASIREGAPAPWSELAPTERHITMDVVRQRFAAAPPPLPSPLERAGVRASAVLAPLYAIEQSLATVWRNLDTGQAAVWTHNANEQRDKEASFAYWRRRLCAFLQVPPGPEIARDAGCMRLVV